MWSWLERKNENPGEIRSGQTGAEAAKISDRNDQLSLRQGDSWTATDKGSQAPSGCAEGKSQSQQLLPAASCHLPCHVSAEISPFLCRGHGGRELLEVTEPVGKCKKTAAPWVQILIQSCTKAKIWWLASNLKHHADPANSLESVCSQARNGNYPKLRWLLMKNVGPPHGCPSKPIAHGIHLPSCRSWAVRGWP